MKPCPKCGSAAHGRRGACAPPATPAVEAAPACCVCGNPATRTMRWPGFSRGPDPICGSGVCAQRAADAGPASIRMNHHPSP